MPSTIILITGANSGVGYATTKVLADASESFHIIMTGRSLDKVNHAMTEIQGTGIKGTISSLQLDVTNEDSIKKAAEAVDEKHGRLDVLINNAALGCMDPDTRTRIQLSMETNVVGPAVVAEAFRPLLFKSSNPYSIFVSSGAGSITRTLQPNNHILPRGEAYMASKAALNMIAVMESLQYGPKGLKVFPVCPGFVVSNLRGTSEEARSGWGKAGDPMESGKLMLDIVEGKRDADAAKLVSKDGIFPW